MLGQVDEAANTVWVDVDAAGYGWSITPSHRQPVESGDVDLLSVVVHEFGHFIGLEHDVLGDTLKIGVRDLPSLESFDKDVDENDSSSSKISAASRTSHRRSLFSSGNTKRDRQLRSTVTDKVKPLLNSSRLQLMDQDDESGLLTKNTKWKLVEV